MESPPSIAIVIPAKNEAQYLERCLQSLRKLDYPKDRLEIIVVDNFSDDETVEIAEGFSEVRTFTHAGNIGALRNFGAQQSNSELIAFIDADCLAPPNWLEVALEYIRGGSDVVSAHITIEDEGCPWIEKCWIEYQNAKYGTEVTQVTTIAAFCFVVKRSTMAKVGWFNESLRTCEDSDLGYRISQQQGRLVVVNRIATVHLRNAKNISEFFRRQVWQGGSNVANLLSHKLQVSELPSVVIPMFYIIFLGFIPVSAFWGVSALTINLVAVFTIPFVIALVKRKNGLPRSIMQFAFVMFLYLTARGTAIFIGNRKSWRM